MPYSPQRAPPIRVPCPITSAHTFKGLYFSETSQVALPVDVVTIFPPVENALSKRFPVFENFLGTTHPIHECVVRVAQQDQVQDHYFLIAYKPLPQSPPNQALSLLVPGCQVHGEILVMRSGKSVLVKAMGDLTFDAARLAVRRFVVELGVHYAKHRRKRITPPLPTQLDI
ncbi:hypothetical protein C8Q76DRAFT_623687 [Earliella scabrosa]|nr:hypothetical protein C8Q76DRAFT_623687 [Earliella scabrosa]